MAAPISVTVTRGGTVESRHRVHAVAVRDGELVAVAGDAEFVTFMRSSAKPIQALPLARAYADLAESELAIACASHLADPEQLAAVERLLARADAREEDLECGPEGKPPRRVKHNCSGKHAGMLAVCRARGWPRADYRAAEHPLQEALVAEVTDACEQAPVATAIDGCGVVTFAYPLRAMAHAFARLERLDCGDRVAAAMRARPALIRGPAAADTRLMHALPGWIAKGGAEALMCASAEDLGVALKAEDGAARALRPALHAFLGELGLDLPDDFAHVAVSNSRGEVVGEVALERRKKSGRL
jgi:L-asparaginase II